MRLGNISPSSTHTTGPHDMPNATTNRLAAISAISPVVAPAGVGSPSASERGIGEDDRHRDQRDRHPDEPMSSSGLRPTLSISAMAISVVSMLITEVITVLTASRLR